jgi:formylglycine-generating enzyme required for sulfatase activity/pimeloyl-ACP methyl ester carboxylesterase
MQAAIALALVLVPAGHYTVTDQVTSLKVEVAVSGFQMSATEVTQREYEAVTGANPSVYRGPDRPVENVSWWDAIAYCNRRSAKESLRPCYNLKTGERDRDCTGYRLPTEAEWGRAAGPIPPKGELLRFAVLGDSSTKSVAVFDAPLNRGTAPVHSLQPNAHGLFDMTGNVWEWCEDWYDAVTAPDAVVDPVGPLSGAARVMRGGSFVSTTSSWSRDMRSSQPPDWRSRFTGFRVVRSGGAPAPRVQRADFWKPYDQPPAGYETATGSLSPLTDIPAIRRKWEALLREPWIPRTTPVARLVREVRQMNFPGQLLDLEMEPGTWERVYVLRPRSSSAAKLPVVIVPFYDVDTSAAMDLGGRRYAPGVNAFAYTAAQRGYIAVAVRWFGESYGEGYSEAVANLALRHKGATGMGKWVSDARRVVDFIATLPDADPSRIAIFGHSLGGKMALYAAAMEPRIGAVVSSELGVGFKHSNYEDYWYLGDALARAPAGTDQHELIAMLAPRPFLLIGGDTFDKAESWHYINAARAVYERTGAGRNVGYFNHHTGHTPTPEAIALGFDWLDHFLLTAPK